MNNKSVNERQCPACGKKQSDSRGQILAVLNEIIPDQHHDDRWFNATCGCKCGVMWDELYDTHTCETVISNIRES